MSDRNQVESPPRPEWVQWALSAGIAWLNAVAYGFRFDQGNHWFELARVAWLQHRDLFPNDPIRAAFAHHPTLFWPVVAAVGQRVGVRTVLLVAFLLTKWLFFAALFRLATRQVGRHWAVVVLLVAIALSPILNELTPLGHSDVLSPIQTHTTFALAVLLWAAVWLLEKRWVLAATLAAATVWIHALLVLYVVPSFAVLAVMDWRSCRRQIVAAATVGALLIGLWIHSGGIVWGGYGKEYVSALLAFYPFHFSLQGHDPYELAEAAGFGAALGMAWFWVRREDDEHLLRMVWLTASFLIPVGLGVGLALGEVRPLVARLQLLRADAFLDLFVLLLIGLCGVSWFVRARPSGAVPQALAALSLVVPAGTDGALLWAWMLLFGVRFFRRQPLGQIRTTPERSRGILAVVVMIALVSSGPGWRELGAPMRWAMLWNPEVPATPEERDWQAVQQWARTHTPPTARFLVPLYPCGFRVFSWRTAWGEWEDGCVAYLVPSFAAEYLRRREWLRLPPGCWMRPGQLQAWYRQLRGERLLGVARENGLDYIVAFRGQQIAAPAVYANQHFAVYRVPR